MYLKYFHRIKIFKFLKSPAGFELRTCMYIKVVSLLTHCARCFLITLKKITCVYKIVLNLFIKLYSIYSLFRWMVRHNIEVYCTSLRFAIIKKLRRYSNLTLNLNMLLKQYTQKACLCCLQKNDDAQTTLPSTMYYFFIFYISYEY